MSPSSLPPSGPSWRHQVSPSPSQSHSLRPTLQGAPSRCTQPAILGANPRSAPSRPDCNPLLLRSGRAGTPAPCTPKTGLPPSNQTRHRSKSYPGFGLLGSRLGHSPRRGVPPPRARRCPLLPTPTCGRREAETGAQPPAPATRSRLCPRLPSAGPGGRPRRRGPPRATPMPPGAPGGVWGDPTGAERGDGQERRRGAAGPAGPERGARVPPAGGGGWCRPAGRCREGRCRRGGAGPGFEPTAPPADRGGSPGGGEGE